MAKIGGFAVISRAIRWNQGRGALLRTVAGRVGYVVSIYVLPTMILLFLWDLASRAFGIPRLFPPPSATFKTLMVLAEDGSLLSNSVASMTRILLGFGIGSLVGIVMGLLMGVSPSVRYLLTPYVDFLRFVGALAWISTFLIWFGIEEASKVMLIIYATTFGVAINVTAGVVAIPTPRLRAAQCFGATLMQTFFWVVLPAAVPFIVSGMRLATQNSFMTIVAAEMIAASKGLGFLIMASRNFMAPDRIFVAILALGILGFLTDRALMLSARLLLARYQLPD